MSRQEQLHAALSTVADACRVARQAQRDIEKVRRITKDDKSPVTVADFAVQAVVAMGLREKLGATLIVGEETTEKLRAADQAHVLEAVIEEVRGYRPGVSEHDVLRAIDSCNHDGTAAGYWALDPIDGTKGFLRGQQYAIALARIEHGRVVIGVMGCPNLSADHAAPLDVADTIGTIYSASIEEGAWEHTPQSRRPIHAANWDQGQPIRACESVESSHSKQDASKRILDMLGAPGTPARLDSQCKYAVVARGQADVYMRIPTSKTYIEKIWDHAAGAIIASEAGAVVSDISGAALDFTHGRVLSANRGIVCAAADVHERVVKAIEQLGIGAAV